MRSIKLVQTALFAALFPPVLAMAAAPLDPVRQVYVVNRAHDSVTALSVAEPGTRQFRPLILGPALRGGGDAATVSIASDACRYDVRIDFRNGRSMVYTNVDVCRYQSLRIDPMPARDDGRRYASGN